MITSLRLETHSASQGSTMLRTLCSKQIGRSVAAIYAVAAFFEANDTFDRSLALEERLERTGRIRYRYHGDQELPYAYGIRLAARSRRGSRAGNAAARLHAQRYVVHTSKTTDAPAPPRRYTPRRGAGPGRRTATRCDRPTFLARYQGGTHDADDDHATNR